MSINEGTFKKLGFRKKSGEKGVFTASAEVVLNAWISVDLAEVKGDWKIVGVEVDGKGADEIRKKYLIKYSVEEVIKLFTDY